MNNKWINECKECFKKSKDYYMKIFENFKDDDLKRIFKMLYDIDYSYNDDLKALEYYMYKYRKMEVSHGKK